MEFVGPAVTVTDPCLLNVRIDNIGFLVIMAGETIDPEGSVVKFFGAGSALNVGVGVAAGRRKRLPPVKDFPVLPPVDEGYLSREPVKADCAIKGEPRVLFPPVGIAAELEVSGRLPAQEQPFDGTTHDAVETGIHSAIGHHAGERRLVAFVDPGSPFDMPS